MNLKNRKTGFLKYLILVNNFENKILDHVFELITYWLTI